MNVRGDGIKWVFLYQNNKTGKVHVNVTLIPVRTTTITVEKQ